MVKINSLKFKYPNSKKEVLKNINLEVKQGDYISIVGENGCGKSTLLKLILKLLKIQSGEIIINAKRIGYLPQKKENLSDFPITLFELLNSYRKILKIRERDCVLKALERVNLSEYKTSLVGELSGGQLQKLYIARALIGDPDLLILDEPSTGIDVHGQKEIYSFVKDLNTQKGLTVISVDHNLDAAIFNSTKIFHIKNGGRTLVQPQTVQFRFFDPSFVQFKPRVNQ